MDVISNISHILNIDALLENMHMCFAIFMILVAFILYAGDRIAMEISSIILISALLLFFYLFPMVDVDGVNILDVKKLLLGFANPALIGVLSLLVMGQAIVHTGALNEIAGFILKISRNNAILSISVTLIFVMTVSAFLNNTPVVVIFIPIMAALAKGCGLSASKVMIPLSFASILGGMVTLIGSSTNLLVSGILVDMGESEIKFFDFSLPGMFLAGVGLVYVLFIMPRLLPERASLVKNFDSADDDRQFVSHIEVDYSSDFVGQKIIAGAVTNYPDLSVRMIQRGEHAYLPPFDDNLVVRPKDILIISSAKKDIAKFFAENPDSLDGESSGVLNISGDEKGDSKNFHMAEIVISPTSKMIGKSLEELSFHSQQKCVVLGVQRKSRMVRSKITETKLAAGDVLVVMGRRDDVFNLHNSKDFLLMAWSTEEFHANKKALLAVGIFGGAIMLSVFNILPITISAFCAVGLILLTKCLDIKQAGRALDLNIVLMIGASIALGTALQLTGGASYIAQLFIDVFYGAPPLIILSAMFFFVMIITNILSNNASAVLVTPIAINLAHHLNIEPYIFIYAVIFACNCSFITPIGYQTNLMVMGPGHYKFTDFIRSGIPLAVIIWLSYTLFAYVVYNVSL